MDEIERKNLTRLQVAYQHVFSGDDGVMVLSDILSQLGYFSNMPERIDPQRIAIANTILSRMNVYDASSVYDYVRSIASQARPVIPMLKEDYHVDDV